MKKNISRVPILIFVLSLFINTSCGQHKSHAENIDIIPDMDEIIVSNIHKFNGRLSYIPLSEENTPVLSGEAIIKYADDKNILIEHDRHLYRFNAKGEFCNNIGSIGQGPGEYIAPGRVSYDSIEDKLYLFTNKTLQQWNLEGDYIETIKIEDPSSIQSIITLRADSLLVLRRDYGEKGYLSQHLQWIDSHGQVFKTLDFSSDSTSVQIAMFAYPEIHKINYDVYFRNEWEGKIFRINTVKVDLIKEFDFGKHNSNRWIFQDVSQREKIGDQYVKIETCFLSGQYSFLSYWFDNILHYIVLDGANIIHHTVDKNDVGYAQGMLLDDALASDFWPSYLDNSGNLYSIIDPNNMDDVELDYFSSKINKQLTTDSNPIIIKLEYNSK